MAKNAQNALGKLRRQLERIRAERERKAHDFIAQLEAEDLRRQIKDAGHEPEA